MHFGQKEIKGLHIERRKKSIEYIPDSKFWFNIQENITVNGPLLSS